MNNIKSYDEYVNEGLYTFLQKTYEEENWEEENDLPYQFDTSIEILASVNRPNRRNIYKIVVNNMHGDADADTKVTVYREKKEDVIKLIDFTEWADELGGYGTQNRMYDIAEKIGVYDIIEGDATNDGQSPASPSIDKITYFDNDGVEHNVRIKQKKIRANYR
jgi:hypothetical protein